MATTLIVRTSGDCENFSVPDANSITTSQTGNVTLASAKKNWSLPAAQGIGIIATSHGFTFPVDNPAGVSVTVILDSPTITTLGTVRFVRHADKVAFEAISGTANQLAFLRGLINPYLVALQTTVVGSSSSKVATGCSLSGYTGAVTLQYYYSTDTGSSLIDSLVKLPSDYLSSLTLEA